MNTMTNYQRGLDGEVAIGTRGYSPSFQAGVATRSAKLATAYSQELLSARDAARGLGANDAHPAIVAMRAAHLGASVAHAHAATAHRTAARCSMRAVDAAFHTKMAVSHQAAADKHAAGA